MWNKIFKSKSNKSAPSTLAGRRAKNGKSESSGTNPATSSSNSSHRSKFSKVVNSFTLKRNNKETSNNASETTDFADILTEDQNRVIVAAKDKDRTQPLEVLNEPLPLTPSPPAEPVKLKLDPCPICTRTFVPMTLAKHVKICEKMAMKKRKIFDSSKQRREGTDLADYLPISFGTPQPKQEQPKLSPKNVQAPIQLQHKRIEETYKAPVTIQTKPTSPSGQASNPGLVRDKTRASKRSQGPTTERCPHCERQFGIKAYDRHVEWCKEKSRLNTTQNNSTVLAAKERLQARTKYRAPCLKTKRAANREKYSGLSESMNSLTDGGGDGFKSKSNSDERKMSMSTSLSSSIMSEGGFSDKYDPFLSAKRQLEELCSPTSSFMPDISPIPASHSKSKIIPSSLTTSYTASSNPKAALNQAKSNFRRTSSLRVSRKVPLSRPLFISTPKQKPTIQRGISDEGPISSNFLKPEEYDEMPVKSVCVNDFATIHSPKVVKRDTNSNLNRRHLKLNLNRSNSQSPHNTSLALSKTDSLAIFLKYENDAQSFCMPKLTEKDLKERTNSLSKQTSLKSSSSDLHDLHNREKLDSLKNSLTNLIEVKNLPDNSMTAPAATSKVYSIKLEPLPKPPAPPTLNLSSILDSKDSNYIDPKLINVCDNLPINVGKLSDSDLTSSSPDSTSTAKFQTEFTKEPLAQQIHQQAVYQHPPAPSSNRNSVEKRNLRKRQMRLGVNQFLYDMSPDSDPYSEQCDKTISMINEPDSNKQSTSMEGTAEPSFDDFDFEQFITSFEDDEQFPIFKDYKEFLSTRSLKRSNNSFSPNSFKSPDLLTPECYGKDDCQDEDENEDRDRDEHDENSKETNFEESTSNPDDPISSNHDELDNRTKNRDDEENNISDDDEIQFGSDFVEQNQNDVERPPSGISPSDINQNNMKNNMISHMDHDFVRSVQNLDRMCDSSASMYQPIDSDEISSVECFPSRKNLKSKQSADSAYGSLSRHSPVDRSSIRRTVAPRNGTWLHQQQLSHNIPDLHVISKPILSQKQETKGRSRDLSASSSGSDTSLPMIQMRKIPHPDEDLENVQKDSRMSKFCHECGSKFLLSTAKFCMECGVKRIALE